MLPVRAFADKRFRTRHFRVLGALCKSYDKGTGGALVSQGKIAKRANLSRGRVNQALPDLEKWGYIQAMKRGRRPGGQFKTHGYVVLWEEPRVTHGGDTAHVNHGGDTTMLPPRVTDSYFSCSNIESSSETSTGRAVARSAHPDGFADSDASADATKEGESRHIGANTFNVDASGNRRKVAHQGNNGAPHGRIFPCKQSDLTKAEKRAREFEADAAVAEQFEIDVAELREVRAVHDRATSGWSSYRRVELDLKLRRETEAMQPAQALVYRRNRYQKLLETGDAGQPVRNGTGG